MCVTDHHDTFMTLAVKVALNPNTTTTTHGSSKRETVKDRVRTRDRTGKTDDRKY